MLNSKVMKVVGVFTISFNLLFASYFFAASYQHQHAVQLQTEQIKNRIALDLDYLNLPEPFFNHVGSERLVSDYIKIFNEKLGRLAAVKVYSIEEISPFKEPLTETIDDSLVTPQRRIALVLSIQSDSLNIIDYCFLLFALIIAGVLSYWYYVITKNNTVDSVDDVNIVSCAIKPMLIINLQNKSISNNITTADTVSLANKPLCFYLALIEYCIENPEATLNQNKDVPQELIELANKYFYRLIELGHTIRKRPNFTNSLEKTLSEIRAALDEALSDYPLLKEQFYPPKAHGEGSRSRLHSYGLSNIKPDDVEVIGK